MVQFIEYYEVVTPNGYEYYFMPINRDAFNKENYDSRSHRIWKLNTRNNHFEEIKNIREGKPQLTKAEFFTIQILSRPVEYNDWYNIQERAKAIKDRMKKENQSDATDTTP